MLMERVALMYETNQMDSETYDAMPDMIREIEQGLRVPLHDENAGACITHLIKAVQRVKDNQAIKECSDELMAQATADERLFGLARQLLAPYNPYGATLDAEAAFIASYFAMLVEEEDE